MRRNTKTTSKGKRRFALLIVLMLFMLYGLMFAEKIIEPTLESVAKVKVQSVIQNIVNDATREMYEQYIGEQNILMIEKDNQSSIDMVQLDTLLLNRMAANVTKAIQTKFSDLKPTSITLSLGSLLGSQLLSSIGPYIEFEVVPIGMTKVGFKTEFEGSGINQTKYKVYLVLDTEARVLVPFNKDKIQVQNMVLVAEAVVIGPVPDSYINVPKDGVLDVVH